jgi:hypothetical protein
MYKIPEISDKKCYELSRELGLSLINTPAHDGPQLAIKTAKGYVDTAASYSDNRYKEILNELKGNVLILGLGLGCNVIRACQKNNVVSVDVVEDDSNIIELLDRIHGNFKGYEKLKLYKGDGLGMDLSGKNYDHVFIDLFFNLDKDYNKKTELLLKRYSRSKTHYINLKE